MARANNAGEKMNFTFKFHIYMQLPQFLQLDVEKVNHYNYSIS